MADKVKKKPIYSFFGVEYVSQSLEILKENENDDEDED